MNKSVLAVIIACVTAVPAFAQEFPLEISHKFGTTIIPERPARVATVDGNGADNILALGLQPVTIEDWYGGQPFGLWPWAAPLLTTKPVLLQRGVLDFEAIAAADPDVILSLYNAMTPEEYGQLSEIAPVVAVPEGRGDWSLTWNERALITGRATGNEAQSIEMVAAIEDKIATIAAENPQWAGKTALIGWVDREGQLGVYSSHDARQQLLEALGFVTPQAINGLDPNGSAGVRVSEERVDLLDVDLLIWIRGDGNLDPIRGLEVLDYIKPHQEGREIIFTVDVTGAFSYGSLLSMPYAVDRMEMAITAAMDGDPTTHADDRPDNW
ncbi:ABC transporter substrate-binding protein [Loktanella agnita]|uniref:ABC transporter substrate-binding protein n=1 Tax=Loktanella agnita TaxID=287097 RepID=UPI003986C65C